MGASERLRQMPTEAINLSPQERFDKGWRDLAAVEVPIAPGLAVGNRMVDEAVCLADVFGVAGTEDDVSAKASGSVTATRYRFTAALVAKPKYLWEVEIRYGRVSVDGLGLSPTRADAEAAMMVAAGAATTQGALVGLLARTPRQKILSMLMGDGETELVPRRVTAYAQMRCDPCSGRGDHACNNCSRARVEQCPNLYCHNGNVVCNNCGGHPMVNCRYCHYGYFACRTCRGHAEICCCTCSGKGAFECNNCKGHGSLTAICGHSIVAEHQLGVGQVEDIRKDRVTAWIRRGAPGAIDGPGDGMAPSALLGTAVIKPDPDGEAVRWRFCGAVTEISFKSMMRDEPFTAVGTVFETEQARYSSFLTKAARSVADRLESLGASAALGDVTNALSDLPKLRDLVSTAMKAGNVGTFASDLSATSKGAVGLHPLERIGKTVEHSVANLSRAAMRRAWKAPLAGMAGLAVVALFSGLPHAATVVAGREGIAPAFALIPLIALAVSAALACRWLAWGSARRLMKDEAGVAGEIPGGWALRTAPAALAGLILAAALAHPVVPFGREVLGRIDSAREIVGISDLRR